LEDPDADLQHRPTTGCDAVSNGHPEQQIAFLLCASKNSLTSAWVEEEIATTLERERKLRSERGKKVLKLIPLNVTILWSSASRLLIASLRPNSNCDFESAA
jgi:hypothetical protein